MFLLSAVSNLLIWTLQNAFFILWIDTTASELAILLLQRCKILWHEKSWEVEKRTDRREHGLLWEAVNHLGGEFLAVYCPKGFSIMLTSFDVVFPSLTGSSKWSLPFRFWRKFCKHFSHSSYPPQLLYSRWFAHRSNTGYTQKNGVISKVNLKKLTCCYPNWTPIMTITFHNWTVPPPLSQECTSASYSFSTRGDNHLLPWPPHSPDLTPCDFFSLGVR